MTVGGVSDENFAAGRRWEIWRWEGARCVASWTSLLLLLQLLILL